MSEEVMKDIRNIAFVGSSGAGKTSLIEQMLFNAKATSRVGKIEEGNTVMDFSTEEIEKGMSMSLSMANFKWKNKTINILDAPGSADFASEQISAAVATETILFMANAASGFEVTLERSIELLEEINISKGLIINRMDSEGADFNKTLEAIKENTDLVPIPIFLPIGAEHRFEGIVDIIKGKAFIKGEQRDIPAEMATLVEESKLSLMEAVAESDDALLEKYFERGELSDEELSRGIKMAVAKGTLMPVFVTSATKNIAVDELLNAFIDYLPSPQDKHELKMFKDKKEVIVNTTTVKDLIAYIFKSFSDPNVGDIAYVRVYSGELKSGMDVLVPEKDSKDKIGSMYHILGKNRHETDIVMPGDMGALVKLKNGRSFNSLLSPNSPYRFPEVDLPTTVYWQTVKAVNQSDEDKIGAALSKLLDEDPTMKLEMNSETNENVLAGIGEQQIQYLQKKLKSRFKIDAVLKLPAIPYKETVKGKADVSYKHKKQSGGRGQYAEVYFKVNPKERGEGFEFIDSIVGGVIPSKFLPAIEKGLKEIMGKGIISGHPVVDISVECYYGSFHDVDSSEMAFKIASSQGLKKAFEVAEPILLEPIHELQIIIPTEYMGDVMGDVSTRRGKILGMEQKGKKQILNAQMPLAELFNYYPALKSLTQGRGRFNQRFSHYEKVPDEIAARIIAEASKREE
ncbi:MAG: elongation factor G [Candidatus Cloacimonetes bacterium]|nr:elongation factor G [Candidatus Cloacimonadota bacterium]